MENFQMSVKESLAYTNGVKDEMARVRSAIQKMVLRNPTDTIAKAVLSDLTEYLFDEMLVVVTEPRVEFAPIPRQDYEP